MKHPNVPHRRIVRRKFGGSFRPSGRLTSRFSNLLLAAAIAAWNQLVPAACLPQANLLSPPLAHREDATAGDSAFVRYRVRTPTTVGGAPGSRAYPHSDPDSRLACAKLRRRELQGPKMPPEWAATKLVSESVAITTDFLRLPACNLKPREGRPGPSDPPRAHHNWTCLAHRFPL